MSIFQGDQDASLVLFGFIIGAFVFFIIGLNIGGCDYERNLPPDIRAELLKREAAKIYQEPL